MYDASLPAGTLQDTSGLIVYKSLLMSEGTVRRQPLGWRLGSQGLLVKQTGLCR